MSKTVVGIDIGASILKLAVCTNFEAQKLVAEPMPDNLVRDSRIISPEATAEFIKKTASKARINLRRCAIILPGPAVFTRTMTLPVMTHEQLVINLPYEFRDFITQEKDKYFFDYALLEKIYDEDGRLQEQELIAAAVLKETIASYSGLCRRAGFRLVTAIPEELGYMNIIRSRERQSDVSGSREYCIIDLGHTATRLHIFKGVKLQATRLIDLGVQALDLAIAESYGIDEHIARARKQANVNDELSSEACMNIYAQISIEIMRAINFYRFNNPDSTLAQVFLCGGGSRIAPLVRHISADTGMPAHKINDLLPHSADDENVIICSSAIGAAMQ